MEKGKSVKSKSQEKNYIAIPEDNTYKIFKNKIKELKNNFKEEIRMYKKSLEKYIEECNLLSQVIDYINDS